MKPEGLQSGLGGAVITEAALMVESEQVLSSAGSVLLLLPTKESHTTSVQTLPKMAPVAQYRDRLGGKRVMPSFGAQLL